jgi:4-hydroxybenzoate polyprenyltransferase
MSCAVRLLEGELRVTSFASKTCRRILDLLELVVSTSIFLSINAALVAVFSFLLYEVEVIPVIVLISFLATFSVYNMNKATDKAEDSINRPDSAIQCSLFPLIMSITALLLCFALSAMVGTETVSVLAVPFIASIAYSVKLRPSIPRLKNIVGVKSIVVAFSWGFTGAFLPDTLNSVSLEEKLLLFCYIFIQLFVNTILCDIRDMEGDGATGIKTLPLVLGLYRVRGLLLLMNSLLLPWLAYCLVNNLFSKYMPALIFGVAYSYILIIVFATNGRNRLLTDFVVDGEWIPILSIMKMLLLVLPVISP